MSGPKPKLHLPFADWPEIDRQMWNAAVNSNDPFDHSSGARLAKTTLHKYWMEWRRFLGFLTITEPDILQRKPFERVTPERVRRFVEDLRKTNTAHSVAIQIDSLYGAARRLMPDEDWTWLRNMKTRLYAVAPRGSALRPVITSVQLVDLGMVLMEESNISTNKPIRMADAILFRDGLMIALLAQIPLRHKNFAALEIGRDVIKEDDNWSIVIPPEETKTRTYLDFEIPKVNPRSVHNLSEPGSPSNAPSSGMQGALGEPERRTTFVFSGRTGRYQAYDQTTRYSDYTSRCP